MKIYPLLFAILTQLLRNYFATLSGFCRRALLPQLLAAERQSPGVAQALQGLRKSCKIAATELRRTKCIVHAYIIQC